MNYVSLSSCFLLIKLYRIIFIFLLWSWSHPFLPVCFVLFTFLNMSQQMAWAYSWFLCQGRKATLCQVKNPKWPLSWLSVELIAGCWCQVSGSVMAGPGGIAVRFSCGSGRCQFHQDQMMATDLFQETLRHLFFSILLRCCLSACLSESVWHACPPAWPVLLWSLSLL